MHLKQPIHRRPLEEGITWRISRCRKQVRLNRHCMSRLPHDTPGCAAMTATSSHVFHYRSSPQLENYLSHKVLSWQDHTSRNLGFEPGPDSHLCCIPGLVFKEHPLHSCTHTYGPFYPSAKTRSATRAGASQHSHLVSDLQKCQVLTYALTAKGNHKPCAPWKIWQWTVVAQHVLRKAFAWWSFFCILVK